MTRLTSLVFICFFAIFVVACSLNGATLKDQSVILSGQYEFKPEFTILYSENDPELAMRPGGIEHVSYNIATWLAQNKEGADLNSMERKVSSSGDGFDDRILKGGVQSRTPNVFNSGIIYDISASDCFTNGDTVHYVFDEHELFDISAFVVLRDRPFLSFSFEPKKEGFFSIGYTGAPSFQLSEVEEIWQPMLWQEKRFPEKPFTTLAFRSPIPATLVSKGEHTMGVLVASEEFPFDPLPTMENSRFGTLIRNRKGMVHSQIYAPVLGGINSGMKPGDRFDFNMYLVVEKEDLTNTYEKIAREEYGFHDFRQNEISSLNQTFENIIAYSLSEHAWFIDSLKGCAYSTDVPGAVKNVSSLNPLELAIVTDNKIMFEERAYPLMEYMLSRQKFLFSLDSTQTNQSPSRKLHGPIAPVSELTGLNTILNKNNPFLVELAENEFSSKRIRNLNVEESGKSWVNAMHLYRATGKKEFLDLAVLGADKYIGQRVEEEQTSFDDPYAGGMFFWPAFVNRWIELFELYEITKDTKYLDAAHDGARHYTMFTWMSPEIPDTMILVNKGGKAPLYWYLKSKGHKQMYFPEESVEAWRLSEIGLTPESSGTCSGHRAIFMANYAPWMLRLGYYTGDQFLQDVAKAAIIGRYRNFPGYHINTARTTAYEKKAYPLNEHRNLSVNSFHYNHIMPMASMLLDYLVTDVFVRSGGAIYFPSEYIEGYAYMQNKFYGYEAGRFLDEPAAMLWMPEGLLSVDNVELNYISARNEDKLFLAFTNQSKEEVNTSFSINPNQVNIPRGAKISIWHKNKWRRQNTGVNERIKLLVKGNGLTVLRIEGVEIRSEFQDHVLAMGDVVPRAYKELEFGNARAMIFSMGKYARRAFIYLRDDDTKYTSITLDYKDASGTSKRVQKYHYPFEFTLDINNHEDGLEFHLSGITPEGDLVLSEEVLLGK
jgi:hypothetical protein